MVELRVNKRKENNNENGMECDRGKQFYEDFIETEASSQQYSENYNVLLFIPWKMLLCFCLNTAEIINLF